MTMHTEVFDAIIAGAGQAGPAIAARCSREGLKAAVIERHHFGGTCVNAGCLPTKTLWPARAPSGLRSAGPSSASAWWTGAWTWPA
jgi:pyruvate/2-oxoglutarate dehydrogenase complex dihydrolipoamide dehydrogenase (E3) component